MATGFSVRTLSGHSDWVRKARVSPCGQWLGSVGNDQTVRVWCVQPGTVAQQQQRPALLFHPFLCLYRRHYGGNYDVKHDLRVHTHVVECLDWAPETASAAIKELAGVEVRALGPMPRVPSF